MSPTPARLLYLNGALVARYYMIVLTATITNGYRARRSAAPRLQPLEERRVFSLALDEERRAFTH